MLDGIRNRADKALAPKEGSFEKSGETHKTYDGEVGDQHVDTSHAGNWGPTWSKGDSFEKSGAVGSVGARGETHGVNWAAGASGPSFKMDGSAKATVGTSGIDIKTDVHIDASLVKAGAQAEKIIPVTLPGGEKISVKVDLGATGEVGANGDLHVNVHIGTNGQVEANVSASGFAGAKASLTGSVSVLHGNDVIAEGDATLSGSVGVGAEGEFHASVGLHGVDFGAKASATVGAGYGVDLEGRFDPAAALNLVGAVAKDVAMDGLHSGVSGIEHEASKVGHEITSWF